jgi:hypothetical protein
MNVWVVHISHQYGNDYRVFKTEEGAREQIKDYLKDIEIERAGLFEDKKQKPDAARGYEWYLPYDEFVCLSKEPLLE